MSMMIGIGTPSSQSSIPRPMSASFFDSALIVAPSKRAGIHFVPAKHTAAPVYLLREPSAADSCGQPADAASRNAACPV
jgi:hypothetical protein